jgi:acetylglutamate kinase
LLAASLSPVFCAITHNRQGQLLNTNADTVASELAVALAAFFKVQLYYCFDKSVVLKDMNEDTSVLPEIK